MQVIKNADDTTLFVLDHNDIGLNPKFNGIKILGWCKSIISKSK